VFSVLFLESVSGKDNLNIHLHNATDMRNPTICFLFILCTHVLKAQVVINEIIPPDTVELKNLGPVTVDISSFILCDFPNYNILGTATTLVCGNLSLTAGSVVSVVTSSIVLAGADGELGLYTSSPFSDPDNIVDYVEWGSGCPHTRSSVAQAAGIWTSGDCVPTWGDCASLEYDGAGDRDVDWVIQNTPTTCAENTLDGCTPLALEILAFRAFLRGKDVMINLVYNDDGNTSRYHLEHSTDLLNWHILEVFDPQNLAQRYTETFTHTGPAHGNNYYRFVIWSEDGTIDYSDIVSVHFESGQVQAKVYPNPARDLLSVRVDGVDAMSKYSIIDENGRTIGSGDLGNTSHIDISQLSQGVYFFSAPDLKILERFVKH
jgi:hypothetical protein